MKSSNIVVINALGDTLKTWKSPDLIQSFIRMLSDRTISDAYRAELRERMAKYWK